MAQIPRDSFMHSALKSVELPREILNWMRVTDRIDQAHRLSVRRAGGFWFVPFARIYSGGGDAPPPVLYGARLLPGLHPLDCPLVAWLGGEAVTYSTTVRGSLASLLLYQTLQPVPSLWHAGRARLSQIVELGQQSTSPIVNHSALSRLQEYVHRVCREISPDSEPAVWVARWRGAQGLVDDHPSQIRCLDLLEASNETFFESYGFEPKRYGVFSSLVATAAFMRARQPPFRQQTAWPQACWGTFGQPRSVDAGCDGGSQRLHSFGMWRKLYGVLPAKVLFDRPEVLHLLAQGSALTMAVEAIAKREHNYAGETHADLAEHFRNLGDYEQAWTMLMNASFWAYRARQSGQKERVVPGEYSRAAYSLAQQAGWAATAAAMEEMDVHNW